MSEFHIIGLGNLCEFVIKNIDEKQTYGTFSACDKHDRKSMQEFVDYVNQLIKENEQLRHDATILIQSNQDYRRENEQLKSDKEHLMGCLIRFFGYDDEDIDYNLNRESNREYGKQYYSMKEETKKFLF